MVLVNGVDGIGSGWSTFVPSFNPKDITQNIRRMLNGDVPTTMIPWFRGFKVSKIQHVTTLSLKCG
jgi:DNA topoisomerase-2